MAIFYQHVTTYQGDGMSAAQKTGRKLRCRRLKQTDVCRIFNGGDKWPFGPTFTDQRWGHGLPAPSLQPPV